MGSLVQIQSPRPFLSSMPALLLTTDDGVHAAGLAALEQALAELGDAYVLAPEREQSACGHALSFFSSRRRHTSSVSAFLLNRSSDLLFNWRRLRTRRPKLGSTL